MYAPEITNFIQVWHYFDLWELQIKWKLINLLQWNEPHTSGEAVSSSQILTSSSCVWPAFPALVSRWHFRKSHFIDKRCFSPAGQRGDGMYPEAEGITRGLPSSICVAVDVWGVYIDIFREGISLIFTRYFQTLICSGTILSIPPALL